MIWKNLICRILLILLFVVASVSLVHAAGAGQCSTRNDCNDCPSKSVSDCACYCTGPGNDPGCSVGRYNGRPEGNRCAGDLSCPGSLARCVEQGCGCGGGGGGGGGGTSTPLPPFGGVKKEILGRIFLDKNRNGGFDAGDKILQNPAGSCGTFDSQLVSIKIEDLDRGGLSELAPNKCNPEPYYGLGFSPGRYRVSVILPEEWIATTLSPIEIDLGSDDRHIWFGVAPPIRLVCSYFNSSSGSICVDRDVRFIASFSGSLGNPIYYKWESGCVLFPNKEHTYGVSSNLSSEVVVGPTTIGSCDVYVSGSVDRVNFTHCPNRSVVIDDCRVSCGNFSVDPNVVEEGAVSTISITPSGKAPFSYVWNSSVAECKLEGNANTAKLTPIKVPPTSGVAGSCPVSVNVRDQSLGDGITCTLSVGVVEKGLKGLSWFKTVDGDVTSLSSISVNIPTREYFGSYLVRSSLLSSFDLTGIRERTLGVSRKNWYIEKIPQNFFPEGVNFFRYFTSMYPTGALSENSELTQESFENFTDALVTPRLGVNSATIADSISLGSGKVIRYYINGDLNIQNNFELQGDSVALFVIAGNLNIASNVTKLSGAFLVDGTVNLTDKLKSQNQLNFKGILAVSSTGRMFGLFRDRESVDGNASPSEVFVYDPKYLVKLLKLFNKPKVLWREVEP